MKDVNKVMLLGRLGGDPIQRATKTGVDVTHFSLATSRRMGSTQPEGEATEEGGEESNRPREETQWHNVVVWGKLAQICGQYLKKGQTAFVSGEIRTRKYLSKNGEDRISIEVHADEVSFLSRGNSQPLTALAAVG